MQSGWSVAAEPWRDPRTAPGLAAGDPEELNLQGIICSSPTLRTEVDERHSYQHFSEYYAPPVFCSLSAKGAKSRERAQKSPQPADLGHYYAQRY